MKWWLFAIVCMVFARPSLRADTRTRSDRPRWHTNYEQAREIARQEGKPLFAVFR